MEPTSIASIAASSFPSNMDMLNSMSSMATNFMNQRFSRQMYDRTRKDNIEFWHMQNQYNSPAAQMARFREAGLNPHLIYGRGESGNAGPIPTPDTVPVQAREPRFEGKPNLMAELLNGADIRIKNAQADNLEVQNDILQQDLLLRGWQAKRAGLDYNLEESLFDVNADTRREGLRKTKTEIDLMINRDSREAVLNASNVQEAAERMLTMIEQRKSMPLERGRIRADTDRIRADIRNMEKEGIIKSLNIKLLKKGINPSDPMWARVVGMFLTDIYEGRLTPSNIGESIWNWIVD